MSRLRLANGKFAPASCGDENCGGALVADTEAHPWGSKAIIRCDGLTYDHEAAPLRACKVTFDAAPSDPTP